MRALIAILAGYLGYRLVKKGYDMTQDQEKYLAKTIWGEARGEGPTGMQAVANVVMNRVKKGGWYGASVKDVVLKPWQFSVWNAKDPNRALLDIVSDATLNASGATSIAKAAIDGYLTDITYGATEYHNKNITPDWNWSKLEKTVTIGNHVFYRSK